MKRSLLLIIVLIGSFSCLAEVVVQLRVATEAPIYAGQRVVLEIDALVAEGWVGIKKIELGEVEEAVVGEAHVRRSALVEEEIGDLLFAVSNLARHMGFSPEAALRRSSEKFERRFRAIEPRIVSGEATDLEAMDALWDEVKRAEEAVADD